MMTVIVKHVLLPALAPLAVVGLYFMPVTLVGCVNRGLMALAVAALSLVAGFVAGVIGLQCKARGGPSGPWMLTSGILLLPAILVLGPLG